MNGSEQDVVHWPFKRVHQSLADSYLSLADEIPADFHKQMLCGLIFWILSSGAGSLVQD